MTVFTSLLNNTFTVEHRLRIPDGQGGWSIVFIPVALIHGRLRPASSTEIVAAQAEGRQITHVFYTQGNEDVQRGDRISVDGLIVDIKALRNPSTASEHFEFDALEYQQEVSESGS